MTGFYGADVEQLRALGRDLEREADALDATLVRLTARIEQVAWQGPDVQRFRADWRDRLVPQTRSVVAGLRDAGGAARANANEQDAVSSGGGGSASGLPSVDPGRFFAPTVQPDTWNPADGATRA